MTQHRLHRRKGDLGDGLIRAALLWPHAGVVDEYVDVADSLRESLASARLRQIERMQIHADIVAFVDGLLERFQTIRAACRQVKIHALLGKRLREARSDTLGSSRNKHTLSGQF